MISAQELKAYVEANPRLVTRRESQRYPGLFVLKYAKKVFFDGSWDDVLIETRGLAADAHKGQVDKANVDYILHPIRVAQIVTEQFGADPVLIQIALGQLLGV